MAAKLFLASGGMDGTVRVWSVNGLSTRESAAKTSPSYVFNTCKDDVFAVGWSPDGRMVAAGGRDAVARIWDLETGEQVAEYRGHSDPIYALAWSPDGTCLASAGRGKAVHLWDVESGEALLTYYGHEQSVYGLAWSPDGKYIASGGSDKVLQVWDANSAELLFTPVHPWASTVYAVAWSPQGTHLAAAGDGVAVYQWKQDEDRGNAWGMLLAHYQGHTDAVYALAWSPDSQRLASSGFDKTVQVWRPEGKLLLTHSDHLEYVRAVAWSPDGRLIASASRDETVRIWDAVTGRRIATYHEHARPVFTVSWSPSLPDDLEDQQEPDLDTFPDTEPVEGASPSEDDQEDDSAEIPGPPLYSHPRSVYRFSPEEEEEDQEEEDPFPATPLIDLVVGDPAVYDWTPTSSPFVVKASNSAELLSYFPRRASYSLPGKKPRRRAVMRVILWFVAVVLVLAILSLCALMILAGLQHRPASFLLFPKGSWRLPDLFLRTLPRR